MLCQASPEGITDNVIQKELPQCDTKQRMTIVNRLLSMVTENLQIHCISSAYLNSLSSLNGKSISNEQLIYFEKGSEWLLCEENHEAIYLLMAWYFNLQ